MPVVFFNLYVIGGVLRYKVVKAVTGFQPEPFYNFIPDIEKQPYKRRIVGENHVSILLFFIATLHVYNLTIHFLFGQKTFPINVFNTDDRNTRAILEL